METNQTREMRIIRTFNAPVELVWEMWSNPEHIAQWWGPKGFTNTIHSMDLTDGGEWKLTMHGPDGTDYTGTNVFREVIPLQKIVYEHFGPHFVTTVLFIDKGEETTLDWTMVFDSAEEKAAIIKAVKADKGLEENLEKLGEYISKLPN